MASDLTSQSTAIKLLEATQPSGRNNLILRISFNKPQLEAGPDMARLLQRAIDATVDEKLQELDADRKHLKRDKLLKGQVNPPETTDSNSMIWVYFDRDRVESRAEMTWEQVQRTTPVAKRPGTTGLSR